MHLIKTVKKILTKNINQFLEVQQKMNHKEHGFRTGRSCLSLLLEHHNNILEELEKSNNIDVIYLDFAKAFDKIVQSILLNKLKKIGINGKVNGTTSSEAQVGSVVPQGSVLEPHLFQIHKKNIQIK